MRALVLGGTGAVGSATVAALRQRGHEALPGSRSATAPGSVELDLASASGRRRMVAVAQECDVVIDASGREDPILARDLAEIPYVDISASAAYLDVLRDRPGAATLVLGAGIAPGVSTVLAAAVNPHPGDALDIAVLLGTGEVHGPAAVAWTAELAGRPIHRAPEGSTVQNLREVRRFPLDGRPRRYLRADFPDHVLLEHTGATIRSYLALGSPLGTAGLALVGALPTLRGILAAAPHWGDDRWRVAVTNRRTGETLAASGYGQSRATGAFAALAAIAAADQPELGAVSMADLVDLAALETVESVTSRR